MTIIAISLINH